MGKNSKFTAIVLALVLLLSGCGPVMGGPQATMGVLNQETKPAGADIQVISVEIDPAEMFSNRDMEGAYDPARAVMVTFTGSSAQCSDQGVAISGSTVTIQNAGVYVLTGTLEDGQILVDAENTDKVQLVLSNAHIHSSTSAAVYVRQADKVFITTAQGTENTLSSGDSFVAVDDSNIDSAIFSKDDLTLNGQGSLTVVSPAGHGIVSKDDLVVTGGQYRVSSAGHGLSGKESIRISGGTLELTAGKDGIHAEDKDDAALGFGYISGGIFTIQAEGDGISVANSLVLDGGEFYITAGGGSENGTKASSGNYGSFSGFGGFGGGPGDRGGKGKPSTDIQTDENSTSMKGIKSSGTLTARGGSYVINAADDGVHSNTDLTVAGGYFQIATGDDGFHAEEKLTVTAGTIQITESYEGLEGHHIAVSGGEISLVASDDGLNAAGGVDSSGMGGRDQMFGGGRGGPGGFGGMGSGDGSIRISGGTLHLQASGDGIDANGTLEITGGYTTVCGPTWGDTATLDYDVSGTISGGTFIGTGASGMAQSFSDSSQGVIAVRIGNATAGTQITLSNAAGQVLVTAAPKLDFSVVIISCSDMVKGERYTITVGDQSGTFQAS